MNTRERIDVRGALLAAGFRREYDLDPNPHHSDTEVWRHTKDRTKLTIEWDMKTPEKFGNREFNDPARHIDRDMKEPEQKLAPIWGKLCTCGDNDGCGTGRPTVWDCPVHGHQTI